MGDSILSIGYTGLAAAQAGLLTAGHNIANVNTPGFSRQQVVQTNATPVFTGGGFVGRGVDITTIRRTYSDFLSARTVASQGDASALSTLHDQLAQVDNMFGDPTTGLSPALDEFFSGLNALAANPSDAPTRRAALSAGDALVSRFNQLAGDLDTMRASANERITGTVQSINGYAGQIAALNRRIMEASAGNATQQPNDLLDQRDALVLKLNESIGARAVQQGDGSYNVFLSNGQALVVGEQAYTLAAVPDTGDPQDLQVALKTGNSVLRFHAADFAGGALSGTLEFRDRDLTEAQNALGRVAVALGNAFNAQHRLGQDVNGAAGGTFFNVPAPIAQPSTTNTGSGALTASIVDANALTASDYRVVFDGTSYAITRQSDGSAQTFASLPQTVDGVKFTLSSGTPAAGDSFLVQPTRRGARDLGLAITDPAKIAAAAPIRTSIAVANLGTGKISAGAVDATYPASPLSGTVTLTYAAGTDMLTGFPATQPVTVTVNGTPTTYAAGAPVPYTAGATIAFGGISLSITGAPSDGDTFTVAPNAGGTADNRNMQALAGLAQIKLVAGGTATVHGAYADMVSGIGTRTQQAGVESDAQAALLGQAQAAQSSASGVNLDEEAADLQRFQQAYQAAGKLMAVANTLFDTILNISR